MLILAWFSSPQTKEIDRIESIVLTSINDYFGHVFAPTVLGFALMPGKLLAVTLKITQQDRWLATRPTYLLCSPRCVSFWLNEPTARFEAGDPFFLIKGHAKGHMLAERRDDATITEQDKLTKCEDPFFSSHFSGKMREQECNIRRSQNRIEAYAPALYCRRQSWRKAKVDREATDTGNKYRQLFCNAIVFLSCSEAAAIIVTIKSSR